MRPEQFTRHANHVAEKLDLGKISSRGNVAALVTNSWERCLKSYGLDPADKHNTFVLDNPTIKQRQDKAGWILEIARQEIEHLFSSIAASGYAILFTDAEGIIISHLCDPTLERNFRKAGLWLGANWSEQNEGTNGIGTCIIEKRAVTIHRDDHFRSRNIGLSCSASPILGPHGEFLAVLDSSTVNCRESRLSQSHTRALVWMSARLIERQLFLTEYRNEYLLHFHSRPECIGMPSDAMVAVNDAGKILAANHNALDLLGNLKHFDLIGKTINEVFDTTPVVLHQHLSKRVKNVWTIRGLQTGKRFFATLSREENPSRWSPTSSQHPDSAGLNKGVNPAPPMDTIAGQDRKMVHNTRCALRVIDKGIPILLSGKTGTGKEAFARVIHEHSMRKDRDFVAINCAAIPESLIESELFGYAHGAFTGAKRQGMKGKIIQANGGTLFLDEIGDMPLHLQSRLLRVLEEKVVCPLGCEKTVPVDFNVISASHCDLEQLVKQGKFREDLYYRLNGLLLTLPNLRDRDDKERLIYSFIESENNSHAQIKLEDAALKQMLVYPWPGNIRQLKNVLRVAIALCSGGIVNLSDLPPQIESWHPEHESGTANDPDTELPRNDHFASFGSESAEDAPNALENAERDALLMTLASHCWNITDTAASLGISRATLYRKLKKYGLPSAKPK